MGGHQIVLGRPVAAVPVVLTPINTLPPSITPTTATSGQALTCNLGEWSQASSFTYQWLSNGRPITGADALSYYVLRDTDIGLAISCVVTGVNTAGSLAVPTNTVVPTPPVINPGAPDNTVLPAITGAAVIGQTITASTGTWTNSPTGYTYQWLRDGVAITGATSSSYLLATGDKGKSISVRVTATNASGSTSFASGVVLPYTDATGGVKIDPASYVNTLVPATPAYNTTLDGTLSEQGIAACAGSGYQTPRVSAAAAFGPAYFEVPADQAETYVFLSSGAGYPAGGVTPGVYTDPTVRYEMGKSAIMQRGVPVPLASYIKPDGTRFVGYIEKYNTGLAAGDTDLSCLIWQPDWTGFGLTGRIFELWRLRTINPANNTNVTVDPVTLRRTDDGSTNWMLKCADGLRVVGATVNPGWSINRPGTGSTGWQPGWPTGWDYYATPNHPTDLDQLLLYETTLMGTSGSRLALTPLAITLDDIRRGTINHTIGLAIPASEHRKSGTNTNGTQGVIWPARQTDGTIDNGRVPSGATYVLPPGTVISTAMPFMDQLIWKCVRDYGIVVTDHTGYGVGGNLGMATEGGGDAFFTDSPNGSNGTKLMSNTISRSYWSQLRRLATGSTASPKPSA